MSEECWRQHHHSVGPTTGKNPGGRQKKRGIACFIPKFAIIFPLKWLSLQSRAWMVIEFLQYYKKWFTDNSFQRWSWGSSVNWWHFELCFLRIKNHFFSFSAFFQKYKNISFSFVCLFKNIKSFSLPLIWLSSEVCFEWVNTPSIVHQHWKNTSTLDKLQGPYERTQTAALLFYLGGAAVDTFLIPLLRRLVYCGALEL